MGIFIQCKLNSRGLKQTTLSKPFSSPSLNCFYSNLSILSLFFLSLAHYTLQYSLHYNIILSCLLFLACLNNVYSSYLCCTLLLLVYLSWAALIIPGLTACIIIQFHLFCYSDYFDSYTNISTASP